MMPCSAKKVMRPRWYVQYATLCALLRAPVVRAPSCMRCSTAEIWLPADLESSTPSAGRNVRQNSTLGSCWKLDRSMSAGLRRFKMEGSANQPTTQTSHHIKQLPVSGKLTES